MGQIKNIKLHIVTDIKRQPHSNMAKKRKGRGKSSVDGAKATPKMKDPDANSQEFMHDKMEMFHLNQDKILLDPKADHEEEEEEGEEDHDGDMFEESDDDGVNDKAWGKRKKTFYNTDVQDEDIYTSDEDGELAAEEEEKEAMVLQKRMAEQLDADDFYALDENEVEEEENEEKTVKKVQVAKDLSKLSKRERLEILAEECPELLPLLEEYKEKMEELRERYHPLVLLVRNGFITNEEGAKLFETKHQLLLNYLV